MNNEFSPLHGVIEDTMQLVLNIKQLVVSNKTGEPGKMTLKIQGDQQTVLLLILMQMSI